MLLILLNRSSGTGRELFKLCVKVERFRLDDTNDNLPARPCSNSG